jgi:hypothetical protein
MYTGHMKTFVLCTKKDVLEPFLCTNYTELELTIYEFDSHYYYHHKQKLLKPSREKKMKRSGSDWNKNSLFSILMSVLLLDGHREVCLPVLRDRTTAP